MQRIATIFILTAAIVLLPSRSAAVGPYIMPQISHLTITAPANFFLPSEQQLTCLMRADDVGGGDFDTKALCYQAEAPESPPPPPPPFDHPEYLVDTAELDPVTGQVTGTVYPCTELIVGFYAVQVDYVAQLDKAGGPATGTMTIVEDLTAPFDCTDGIETSGPLTMTPLAQSHDDDIWGPNPGETGPDGCSTWEELGATASLGGLRDPFNFWDFYDAPTTGTPPVRDQMVNILDIGAIVARFGATGVSTIDPLSPPPPAPPYHPAFDRSSPVGPDLWNLGPADGDINIIDTGAAVAQFGHTCVAAP